MGRCAIALPARSRMRHDVEGAAMSEWWSYRPSDFLMFSPRIYWRLFGSINEAFWPAQPALIALGLAWLARARAQRLAAGALAIASVVVAWAFLWQRFTPINWPA